MKDIHERERLLRPEQLAGIDLNLIVAFDALAREGSVTRAARRVGVTQSAMSHSLRRLRDLLGDPVLVRAGNGMALTPRAESLVEPLPSGLVLLGRALLTSIEFEPATARRAFCLATLDLFDVLVMPPLLARVRADAPSVDLKLVPGPGLSVSATLSAQLETGEVDIAIVPRFDSTWSRHASATLHRPPKVAPEPAAPGIVQKTLFRDGFTCLLRADHPALSQKATRGGAGRQELSLETYLMLSHALVSPRGDAVGAVDEALEKRGLRRRIALSVPQFTSALAIVAKSDLVLTAPAALARVASAEQGVVALPPPLALPEHSVQMMWHERVSNDPGHRWLRGLVSDAARGAQTGVAGPSGGAARRRAKR